MNCKQIEDLLPLYAGRDLAEKSARSVSEHLQACKACTRVANEYQDALGLTQHFAPPVFTDKAYASVRRQVMQQIDRESPTPLLPQLFVSWFRPRMAWAVASALMIAFAFLALYLVVNRNADVRPVAGNNPLIDRTGQTPESIATPRTTGQASTQSQVKPADDKRLPIRNFVNRSPLVAARATNSSRAVNNAAKLRGPEANGLPGADAVPEKSPMRVEMQTKDPNIRIIWFSQSNSKPTLPTKGI